MRRSMQSSQEEDITDGLSEEEVLTMVQTASDRIVTNLEKIVDDSEIEGEEYRILLVQNDSRAVRKAYEMAEEDGIKRQFTQAFRTSLNNAIDDPAGWLQVILTASLTV